MQIKVFDYIPELDCFVVRDEFVRLVERLHMAEWTPVVWICRLLALDNDFGEHIFDNWDEREQLVEKARTLGIKDVDPFGDERLMVVVPERFRDHDPYCTECRKPIGRKAVCPACGGEVFVGSDGPCHSDAQRKRFWTDVFKCLAIDLETIFWEAKEAKFKDSKFDLEKEIIAIKSEYKM